MNEKEIELLNKAYENYNLDLRPDIEKELLEYIYSRFKANYDEINMLITDYNSTEYEFTYNELNDVFQKELESEFPYKKGVPLTRLDNGFVKGSYLTSIGIFVVDVSNPIKVLQLMIKAIKTRNSICISDYTYSEVSVNSALLIIFCEALAKYSLDRNLIMLLPTEECYYEEFENIIYMEDGRNEVVKPNENRLICIYQQEDAFDEEVSKQIDNITNNNIEYVLEKGEIDEVIKRINREHPICATIFTTNSTDAYKFTNLICASNVFVNSSPLNFEENEKISNPLLIRKNFIYPFKMANESVDEKKSNEENLSERSSIEQALIKNDVNPWYKKIINKIISLFK